MSKKDVNPWDYFLQDTTLDNEIAYRSIAALTNVKRVADTLYRTQQKRLDESDFEVRDILFTGSTKDRLEHPNLFYYANLHYRKSKALDSTIKFNNLSKECVRKNMNAMTKEKYDSQQTVVKVSRNYKVSAQVFFSLVGLGVAFALGLNKNPMSHRVVTVLTGMMVGTFYGEFKYATKIFDEIPPLPDKELEQERMDIFNYCFSVDINQITHQIKQQMAVADEIQE